MSDKNTTPMMDPQSEADKDVLKALGALSNDLAANTETDDVSKGGGSDTSASDGEKAKPDGQGKADGDSAGQMEALKKTKDKDEDEDEEDEEKSISDDDLSKALSSAIAVISGADPDDVDRRAELAEKMAKSGSLSDEEMEEFRGLLSSPDSDDAEDLQRGYAEMSVDDPLFTGETQTSDDGSVDVAEYLQRQAAFIGGALDQVATEVQKGFQGDQRRSMALAKGLQAIGKVVLDQRQKQEKIIKALTDRIDHLENRTPGRRSAPTARSAEQILQRGFGGDADQPDLSKGELVKGLVELANDPSRDHAQRDMFSRATTRVECGQMPGRNAQESTRIVNEVRKQLGK